MGHLMTVMKEQQCGSLYPHRTCQEKLTAAEMLTCCFQSQRTLKASHDAAMMKVDELSAQLKDEKMKSLDLEKRLQSSAVANIRMEQVSARSCPPRVLALFHLT